MKFAARCDLTIEPETYRRMMEHRGEIAKCAQARVSEEFYRLLRAGAAKRSLELLVETDLLELMVPDLAKSLKGEPADEQAALRRARLWRYLEALDQSALKRPVAPSNALLLATLMLPPLRDALDPDSNGVRDIGQLVTQSLITAVRAAAPVATRQRDRAADPDRAAIPAAVAPRPAAPSRSRGARVSTRRRCAWPTSSPRPRRPIRRWCRAPSWRRGPRCRTRRPNPPADELDPVAMELLEGDRRYGRDRGRDRDRDRRPQGPPPRPTTSPVSPSLPPMDLGSLASAARALLTPDLRPAFLGSGGFGGPWAARGD